MSTVKIALIQTSSKGSKSEVVSKTVNYVREAVEEGAQIVCLQELFNLPYFCTEQNPECFDLAETIPGPSTAELGDLCKELGIYLIVPVFESVHGSIYYNTAVVIDPKGEVICKYRKNHIPQDPGFEEKFFFSQGDLGWPVFETPWGKMGVMICWDQWYPEAARLMALQGAKVLFYPTAIGRLESETDALGTRQHRAWETVQRGHGIANGCFVAACNRIGREGDTHFWGQSFVSDYYGTVLGKAGQFREEVLVVELNLEEQEEFRRIWPFFRDRRIDSYGDLTKRVLE